MGAMATKIFRLPKSTRDLLDALRPQSTAPWGPYDIIVEQGMALADGPGTLVLMGQDESDINPQKKVEKLIAHDCKNGVDPNQIAQVRVYSWTLFLAMLADHTIPGNALRHARFERERGNENVLVVEHIPFFFPDGQERSLTVVMDLRETDEHEMCTCLADGTFIL